QSEIAKTIAEQLQAKLSLTEKAAIEQRPTADLAAFDLYTRAKMLRQTNSRVLGTNNRLQAVGLLNQAVALDPTFLLAWCELAITHDLLYFLDHDHTATRLALAKAAVQTALVCAQTRAKRISLWHTTSTRATSTMIARGLSLRSRNARFPMTRLSSSWPALWTGARGAGQNPPAISSA